MRTIRILLLAGLMLALAAATAMAAPIIDLKATKTASGQTTLVWTFTAGDTIEMSTDGLVWNALPNGAIQVDPADTVDGNTKVIGLVDYTNYYFRIKDAAAVTSNVVDAFPPNEHAHRYFAADTNQCSRCHSTHVAVGAKLLKTATVDGTCKTCHAGTGAKYQVDSGTVPGPGGTTLAALAGPFGTTINPASSVTPTSAHNLGAVINTAPGGDPSGTGAWAEALGCGSCHSAHVPRTLYGSSGDPALKLAFQYRLLVYKLPNMLQSNGSATPTTLTTLPVVGYAVTLADKEGVNYVSGMNNFCGGCHADYNTSGVLAAGLKSGSVTSGVFNTTMYRHAVGRDASHFNTVLPREGGTVVWDGSQGTSGASGQLSCLTCHKVHGTQALNSEPLPDGTPNHSRLLRLDNRGVCQSCHNK